MTLAYLSAKEIQGLAADTKPVNVPANTLFYETDTFTTYKADGSGGWKELSQKKLPSYIIYQGGGIYKAMNGTTGVVDLTHATDIGVLLNSVISALTLGGNIYIDQGNYNINTVVSIPSSSSGSVIPINIEGVRNNVRNRGTSIIINSAFPTGRYIFEAISANASSASSSLSLKNLIAVNNTYARSGTSLQNIAAGATIIDAGLVKFESDNNVGIPLVIENIATQYLWRGVHLIGYLYWPSIRNYVVADGNINCVSDTHIIMEKGTHADYPKGGSFEHIILNSVAGSSSGTGSMNNAIVFGGGYHNVRHVFVDGSKYNNSVIAFMQCFTSSFYGMGTIDLNSTVTQGGAFKGVFLLDTTDFSGNVATTSYSTYNNQIYDIFGSPVANSVSFKNSPFRNRIRLYAYWGGNAVIDDAGAGVENVIEIIEGQQPLATANAKITTSNSIVKLIDSRVGSTNQGISTQSGDGTTKVFNIAHSCFATPSVYNVRANTAQAAGSFDVTVGTTNITITYPIAPQSGSSNLKWQWYASVY